MSAGAYLAAAETLLRESGCTVRKWSGGMGGRAYITHDDWGIVAPQPRGPVSFAVFAHEVGHQVLHRLGRRPRWLEEIEAWEYALAQFERFGLRGEERARKTAKKSLVYAAAKAERRCSPETATRILDRYSWVFTLTAEEKAERAELLAAYRRAALDWRTPPSKRTP